MRIFHTADWHLGHELYGFARFEEHDAFLRWLIEQTCARRPDALIVSGDIYHSPNPSVRAQKQLYRFLSLFRREAPNVSIVLTGGNHDSPPRLELPLELAAEQRFSPLHVIGAMPQPDAPADRYIRMLPQSDGAPGAACVCIPYLRPIDLTSGPTPSEALAQLYRAAYAQASQMAPGIPVILMGHLNVAGGELSALSERRILVGAEEAVSTSIFPEQADYVALGHLHRPQTLKHPSAKGPPIRYSGAPIPLSNTERTYKHSITQVDFTQDGPRLEIIEVPRLTPFLRAPKSGAAPLEEVLQDVKALAAAADSNAPEHLRPFLEVVVSLDGPEPELRQKIQTALADAPLRLTRVVRAQREAQMEQTPAPPDLKQLSCDEVFAQMHQTKYGAAPDPSLALAFRTLLADIQTPDT